jgi:hypothetical protein
VAGHWPWEYAKRKAAIDSDNELITAKGCFAKDKVLKLQNKCGYWLCDTPKNTPKL